MFDAMPSVANAAEKESINGVNGVTKPTFFQQHWRFLAGAGIAATPVVAGTGLVAYEALKNPNAPINTTISGNSYTIPPLASIKDSTGNDLTLNVGQYDQQITSLKQQQGQLELNKQLGLPVDSAKYNAIDDQLSALSAKKANTQNIIDSHTKVASEMQGLTEAQQLVSTAQPQWWQVLSGKSDLATNIRAKFDPGFAKFQQSLDQLRDRYGIDTSLISSAGNTQAAQKMLDQQAKQDTNRFKQSILDNGGQWPDDTAKETSGKDIIQHQMNQVINTGSPKLDSVLTPSPTPQQPDPTPTDDPFQTLLKAKYQQGAN
jgi:hypothetical protein